MLFRSKKSSLPRPKKELKGFYKINLLPGEEKNVSFTIKVKDLQFFDDSCHQWIAEPGRFEAVIAASATDIKGKVSFDLE